MPKSSQARVVSAVVVLVLVGLALRSCVPSRTVGRGAVEEACFAFSRGIRLPTGDPAHDVLERARDAAARSQDPILAADVSRAVSAYADGGNRAMVIRQIVVSALGECATKGWATTDPCTYGAVICKGDTPS